MSEVRVLIADDHAMFRDGIRRILEAEPDLRVVGEASSGGEALELVPALDVHLLVLDLGMPGRDGIEVAEHLRRTHPALRILVLTMHKSASYLSRLLELGVHGYLLKESTSSTLVLSIRRLLAGEIFVDASLTTLMVGAFVGRNHPRALASRNESELLSPREREVCREIALGFSNPEIAERLAISKRTVDTHRERIMDKLHLSSRAELVRYALKAGLLESP